MLGLQRHSLVLDRDETGVYWDSTQADLCEQHTQARDWQALLQKVRARYYDHLLSTLVYQ